jgi:chromate transporter
MNWETVERPKSKGRIWPARREVCLAVALNVLRGDDVNWKLFRELFTSWFKIGLFTFGGGYAMLPLIEKEVIDRRQWSTQEEILDIFALSQSLPGAIAINSAIFLGYRLGGVSGAVVSAVGVVLPSLLVILAIAVSFAKLKGSESVMAAFAGIRAAVAGLVAAAAVRIARSSVRNLTAVGFAAVSLGISLFTEIHAAWVILVGALAGIVIFYFLPLKKGALEAGEDKS